MGFSAKSMSKLCKAMGHVPFKNVKFNSLRFHLYVYETGISIAVMDKQVLSTL